MDARGTIAVLAAALIWAAACAGTAAAQTGTNGFDLSGGASPFSPRVPVSEFARPASWLDPSRLHISTTVSVGTGWGGGTDGMQVTSLSYQLASPLAVQVSLANAFGASAATRGNGMFLEGLHLAYRPHPMFQLNIDYRDIRSPLQYSNYPDYGLIGR
jgi:hypothetical protein